MSTFTSFDPFRELDRVFTAATRGQSGPGIPMDIYRDGHEFVVELDLPGADPSSLEIDVDDRSLTIRAERQKSRTSESAEWLTRERSYGTYARQLTLGRGLATDKIDASYTNGVLRLVIPVAEEAKPRKISVRHDSSALNEGGDTVQGSVTQGSDRETSGS